MELLVATGFGMETATKLELKRFNINAPCIDGQFVIEGEARDVAFLNLHLRTADRVLIRLKDFRAESFDELFDGIEDIDWNAYIPENAAIIVIAKSVQSKLFALSAIQSIAKKAVVNRLLRVYKSLPEDGAPYKIEINLLKDRVTVAIDTSGAGLHKRGYRKLTYDAPLKETLAAGIIELSGWRGETAVIDCFTGSGTFPIECCMRALNIPAGFYREFAFENYNFIDKSLLAEEKKLAAEKIDYDAKLRISGFDINRKAIVIANASAEAFNLQKYIHFETADMRNVSSRYRGGVLFANPPYGERLGTESEIRELYADFGKVYRALDGWSAHIITSYPDFERCFRKKADRERKLYNAKLLCRLYSYYK